MRRRSRACFPSHPCCWHASKLPQARTRVRCLRIMGRLLALSCKIVLVMQLLVMSAQPSRCGSKDSLGPIHDPSMPVRFVLCMQHCGSGRAARSIRSFSPSSSIGCLSRPGVTWIEALIATVVYACINRRASRTQTRERASLIDDASIHWSSTYVGRKVNVGLALAFS